MAEVEITKKQVITVVDVGENEYGDLTFRDKAGNDYKVSAKRRQYFDSVITVGAAVQLNYSKFKGTEYVYSASPVKDLLTEAKKLADTPPEKPIPKAVISGDDVRNRSMCISYSKDLACAGKIELKDISVYADKFLEYILKK